VETKKILTPAKINLYLEVIDKRKDGYHNIYSLIDLIGLYDEIEVHPSKNTKVKFYGKWKIPENNTVIKTLDILKTKFSFKSFPFFIKINKKIPPGSGLGGASSDAAAILKVINKLSNLNLDEKTLIDIGTSIGADVPLFLKGKRCIIRGKGEKVKPIINLNKKFKYIIYVPNFEISTKIIYEKLKSFNYKNLTSAKADIKILLNFMYNNDIENIEKKIFNRLEEVSLSFQEEIKKTKIFLEKFYNKKFFLTGTGGALYSIFSKNTIINNFLPVNKLKNWQKIITDSI
jgi:4-diphosphocytidyl-2-C-methyl-D-erythritol kinase